MKAIAVVLLACVLVPGLALAQEGQAPAQGNLNTITGVNVRGGTVEIVGTKKPNFTTFTMTDPPRLVIDISEAVFSGVKEDISVGNGTITAIRTASYGSDESAIARVLIGFERDVDPDIQATGNSLVVSVGGGAAVAARPSAPAGTAPGTTPGGGADQAAVAAQAEQQQQEKAAAQAAVAAQAERQQQEKAAAQAAAAAQADAEAQRQAQARADADRKAQEEAARVAAQQAEQQARADREAAAAAEKQRQEEARAAAEEKKRLAAEARERQREEARAAAEEKKRLAAEARERQREEAQAAAEERKRERAEARQARIAQAETPRRASVEQGDGSGDSSRRKTMTLVGFKQESSASRVFVRTNEPVRYTVTEGDKEVVLELENTRIVESNNTLPLNTSFFDTAVVSVDPQVGPSRTVRVAIKLKEQVPFQTHQDGNELSIEFQRPARR
ncbi:AMIN domain-containing protein [Archangium violaceum]|uniref:AMIN domain-containing protein n=1 Tax=Archangium violaceum TaxID=83451 RepID=UPI00193C4ECC|nr:AMIN domain-containing protein [Archangium violaceum]QRK07866.1 AMIN domain-containing protein [Archangium violaceum]